MKMSKISVLAATMSVVAIGHAAALDWQYASTADEVGSTVYVMMGATAQQEWESLSVLKNAALDSSSVVKSGRNYLAAGSVSSDSLVKGEQTSIYYVVVASDEGSFSVTSVADMTSSVYNIQDGSSGTNKDLSNSSITKSGIAWGTGGGGDPDPGPGPVDPDPPTPGPGGDVPEPTSGILLMIGGAALALRRRR